MTQKSSPIILALDLPNGETALSWSLRLKPHLGHSPIVKVGMRLFYAEGATIVKALQDEGFGIFLDLKLYDIPNTVQQACESLAELGVDLLTIHASGGAAMMQAACRGLAGSKTNAVAVTCLTSFDQQSLSQIFPAGAGLTKPSDWAIDLAALAVESGINTLVCSPQEIASFRQRFGDAVTLITPGVRPSSVVLQQDDQARVMTPEDAIKAGANYLVIGRPILQADNPEVVCQDILSLQLAR